MSLLLIILGTLASEDLTCITVGLLVRSGELDLAVGLAGCFLGIVLGDVGLWWIGRLAARGLLRWPWASALLTRARHEQLAAWFEQRGWVAVLAVRFLPGTRLPLYLAAGALGRQASRFALWAAVAGLVWTPLLVLTAVLLGHAVLGPAAWLFGPGVPALLLGGAGIFLLVRGGISAGTARGRARCLAAVSRLWRWEFWPGWLFYLPILPWLAWLSLRYRGALVWTAANPGIPHGGVVGESKFAILAQLPARWVVPGALVPAGAHSERLARVRTLVEERGWAFPLILKPDVGQRGAGVRRVRDFVDVQKYLLAHPGPVIVQVYHPGPHEAGIFYYRLPGAEQGRIFSITDKVFPVLVGDGRATVEELIWRHPRYRMQAHTFLARHTAERDRVLAAGEMFSLGLAGNHCQGTLFRDGGHLLTPELEAAVDALARPFAGFFVGRFDVRYHDVAAFRAGTDLAIVELNGVTSESTNLYDPSWSLLRAYGTLCRQWSLLYRIGAANRDRGHPVTRLTDLVRLLGTYYRGPRVDPRAD